jgi:transcriptional regulator with GAF, ATPase, and Fis domain
VACSNTGVGSWDPHYKMNAATQRRSFVLTRSAKSEPAEKVSSAAESMTGGNEAPVKDASALDPRVSSLKILASTLLERIKAWEDNVDGQGLDGLNLHDEVHRFERDLIRSALIRTGGRQRRAAKLLGVKVTTLNNKIKRLGIRVKGLQPLDDSQYEAPPDGPLV